MSLASATGPGGQHLRPRLPALRRAAPRPARGARSRCFTSTLRACFGIGRGGRAKIAPFALAGLAILPAILAVGHRRARGAGRRRRVLDHASPVRYATYHGLIVIAARSCSARPRRRSCSDATSATASCRSTSRGPSPAPTTPSRKLGGLVLALLIVDLFPQLHPVHRARPRREGPGDRPRRPSSRTCRSSSAQALLTAGLLGGMSSLIAAWTPRRAYATAGIIAALRSSRPIVIAIVDQMDGGDLAQCLLLLSPGDVLDGPNSWIFGAAVGRTRSSPALGSARLGLRRGGRARRGRSARPDRPPLPADPT